MKPYQFFCYVAKYFRVLEAYEHNPTPQRAHKIETLRSTITKEINNVEDRIQQTAFHR